MPSLTPVGVLDGPVRAAGILHFEPNLTGNGHQLHRLPAWTQPQVVDPAMLLMRAMPSGARLEFVTDATTIELDVQLTIIQIDGEGVGATFDLVIDGEIAATVRSDHGNILSIDMGTGGLAIDPGGSTTIAFTRLAAREKLVEIWLPNAATVELLELRTDGTVTAPPDRGQRRWIHYGSSISHSLEATQPTGVWPAVAARLAGVDLQSFGFGGQCQLDGYLARTIRDLPADLISCKVGINIVNGDTMRERTFLPAVHNLLDTIREGHPDTPVVLITPIFCPAHEDKPGPTVFRRGKAAAARRPDKLSAGSLSLQRIRQLEAEIVQVRQQAGDANLHLMSGLDLFGPADVDDLPDLLHPNPAGYRRIGERFHELAFGPGGPFAP